MNKVQDALIGLAVGDALGVPVEFIERSILKKDPVVSMREFGTHNQPAGTWSDDASMNFCLAESLLNGYNLADIAKRFVMWTDEAYWTPNGIVFDIGITTSLSIDDLREMLASNELEELRTLIHEGDEFSNGNGSLMRILPLLFFLYKKDLKTKFQIIQEVSGLTHRHVRAAVACLLYLVFAEKLLDGVEKKQAFKETKTDIRNFLLEIDFNPLEYMSFEDILDEELSEKLENEIKGSGYVMDCLEASIWCFLTTETYKDAVLKAVNLGDDTDTTGAVTGGLAGLYYGLENIPKEWVSVLARKSDVEKLCNQLNKAFSTV